MNLSLSQQTTDSFQTCQFGHWRFDPVDGQLRSKQKNVRLPPRLSKLLSIFTANAGVLLSRDQLIDRLWQDKSVNEDALSRCIAELRSVLGDNSSSPTYIETVPKKGYRFISLVSNASSTKTSGLVLIAALVLTVLVVSYWYFSSHEAVNKKNLNLEQTNSTKVIEEITAKVTEKLTKQIKDALLSAERLTADLSIEHQPTLSPSGDKISFSVMQGNRLVVKILSSKGELLHEIKEDNYHLYSATFSQDEQSLLIAAIAEQNCSIFLYQLPSLQKKKLGMCESPDSSVIFDWSSDAQYFVYVAKSQHSNNAAIWLYDLASKQSTQLTKPDALNIFDTRPKFSPDDKQLGFTRGTKSTRNVYSINLDEPDLVEQQTQGRGYISSFDWLKDSRHFVFDSDQSGEKNLWLFNTHTKQQQLLGARDSQYPSLNKDNTRLAFQEIRYNANIWSVDLIEPFLNDNALTGQVSEPKRIIQSIKYNNFPAFSPDGNYIAFSSNRQGKSAIWLYSLADKKQVKLLSLPNIDLVMPNWSADGKKLLVSGRGIDGYRCYKIDVESGKYQAINLITSAHYACVFSDNGDVFAITKEPSEQSQLLKLTVNGKIKQLTDFAIGRVQTTNLGTLIYSLESDNGLYSMDLNGQQQQLILKDFSHNLDEHWTVQGSYLYYPKVKEGRGIWRRNLETGEEQKVTTELPSTIGLTLSVDPSHSLLVYSQTDSRQSDIYLSNIQQLFSQENENKILEQ